MRTKEACKWKYAHETYYSNFRFGLCSYLLIEMGCWCRFVLETSISLTEHMKLRAKLLLQPMVMNCVQFMGVELFRVLLLEHHLLEVVAPNHECQY